MRKVVSQGVGVGRQGLSLSCNVHSCESTPYLRVEGHQDIQRHIALSCNLLQGALHMGAHTHHELDSSSARSMLTAHPEHTNSGAFSGKMHMLRVQQILVRSIKLKRHDEGCSQDDIERRWQLMRSQLEDRHLQSITSTSHFSTLVCHKRACTCVDHDHRQLPAAASASVTKWIPGCSQATRKWSGTTTVYGTSFSVGWRGAQKQHSNAGGQQRQEEGAAAGRRHRRNAPAKPPAAKHIFEVPAGVSGHCARGARTHSCRVQVASSNGRAQRVLRGAAMARLLTMPQLQDFHQYGSNDDRLKSVIRNLSTQHQRWPPGAKIHGQGSILLRQICHCRVR